MRRDDRGAVAVLSALFVSFVMVAIAAMAVDAGAMYAEQRELQNGADAAALAIAQDCFAGRPACTAGGAAATATTYVNAAASDGTSASSVTTFDPLSTVTVEASTRTSSGATVLPAWFSGRANNGRLTGRATVSWGWLGRYTGLPMTISIEEWQQANGTGGFAPAGPYTPGSAPLRGYERVLQLTGQDAPGSFGWLDNTGGTVTTSAGQYQVTADTGSGFKDDKAVSGIIPCMRGFQAVSNSYCTNTTSSQPTVKYVPVYDSLTGTGNNTEYHIAGYAAFVLTGYQLPGVAAPSWLTGQQLKDYIDPTTGKKFGGDAKMLTGFYTHDLVKDQSPGGGDFGVGVPPKLVN